MSVFIWCTCSIFTLTVLRNAVYDKTRLLSFFSPLFFDAKYQGFNTLKEEEDDEDESQPEEQWEARPPGGHQEESRGAPHDWIGLMTMTSAQHPPIMPLPWWPCLVSARPWRNWSGSLSTVPSPAPPPQPHRRSRRQGTRLGGDWPLPDQDQPHQGSCWWSRGVNRESKKVCAEMKWNNRTIQYNEGGNGRWPDRSSTVHSSHENFATKLFVHIRVLDSDHWTQSCLIKRKCYSLWGEEWFNSISS